MTEKLISLNPANGQKIGSYKFLKNSQIPLLLKAGNQAFEKWRNLPLKSRRQKFIRLAQILRKNADQYARLISLEMGKPLAQAKGEIEKCARGCEFYAKQAEQFLKNQIIQTESRKSYVCFEPLGLILGIMPWNFPFWQVFRFAIPALLAGNGVLLKHSPNVTACALEIEKIFLQSGFPKHLFQSLLIPVQETQKLISHPLVRGASLTGSVKAGRTVAEIAGRFLKKTVLELGGSDPFIVLEDADIPLAIQEAITGRFANCGQSCIAAKRFILLKPIAKKFIAGFLKEIQKLKMGDPLDPETSLGPLAREDLRKNLHRQIKSSLRKGTKLVCGGKIPKGKGFFYPPTLVQISSLNLPLWREEVFGPVAVFHVVNSEHEALRIANDSDFGLGASLYTRNLKKGEKIARQLETGNCFINQVVHSDPRLPFGGVKNSGLGRELSHYGLQEFVNIKTLSIYPAGKGS